MLFVIVCLRELEVPRQWWQLPLLGKFKFYFIFGLIVGSGF